MLKETASKGKNILGPGATKQKKPEEAKRFKIRFELLRERFVMVENVVWKEKLRVREIERENVRGCECEGF